jgi:hypothetical protein
VKYIILFFCLISNVFAQNQNQFTIKTSEIFQLFQEDFKTANRPTDLDLFWKGKLPMAISDYDKSKSRYGVSFWGGLYRHEKNTERTWAFAVCHELGHILGGAPTSSLTDYEWGSSEGQADYFAAGKCLKRYYESLYQRLSIQLPKNEWIYNEILVTAQEMSDFFNYEATTKMELSSIGNKDLTEVLESIRNGYPTNQCRIDTIVAGVLCENWPCLTGKGMRPRCWFKN